MRVLVTGSTGLVGRACAARLAELGHEVIGAARGESGDPSYAAEVRVDLADPASDLGLAEATGPCEAIVHAAASRSRDDADAEIALVNCLGTQRMLALATAWDSAAFVYISGVTVIGSPRDLPVTEEHPAAPPNAYLASKLFGEQLAAVAGGPLRTCSLRLTAPVGPLMPADRIVAVFVQRALAGEPLVLAGTGGRRQDYIDVRDAAVAVGLALERPATGVLNVAAGESISNRELAELCVSTLASASPIEYSGSDPADDLDWAVSIERASSELGWRPERRLESTIGELAARFSA
ncbi:MAG: dTDP-glucose 4,6-dehydratase [Solirubrobacterales bacterium]|jgi:nucleoside-diphosphate-sugar epimerase|nr:dTDP-glucose 4,6-dehydratase [Solirubrobacterales bacterium]